MLLTWTRLGIYQEDKGYPPKVLCKSFYKSVPVLAFFFESEAEIYIKGILFYLLDPTYNWIYVPDALFYLTQNEVTELVFTIEVDTGVLNSLIDNLKSTSIIHYLQKVAEVENSIPS